jgi:flagellar hook-length control protein FliK
MSQTSITQMMMSRLGTDTTIITGAATDKTARTVQKDAFSSILSERMNTHTESNNNRIASELKIGETRRPEQPVKKELPEKAVAIQSKPETIVDRRPEQKNDKAVTTVAPSETKVVKEATVVTPTDETAPVEEVAAEVTDESVLSQIATLLDRMLLMLEEQVAAMTQGVADGTAAVDATELSEIATQLVELLTQLNGEPLKGNTDVLEMLKAEAGSEMPENLKALLEKLAVTDTKLTLVKSSDPEQAKGNNLFQLKLMTEGYHAKIKLLTKPEKTEAIADSLLATTGIEAESDDNSLLQAVTETQNDASADDGKQPSDNRPTHVVNESAKPVVVQDSKIQMTMVTENGQKVFELKIEPTAKTIVVEKPTPMTDVQKNAMTSQVVEKVKLMSGEHKSELEMTLKPESLGKVNLKLIEERGQILARFTAESEQVKSVLESNMQLLKDALEKSGVSISDLSVSVGQQQQKGTGHNGSTREGKQDRSEAETTRINISEKLRRMPSMGSYSISSRVVEYLNSVDTSINVTA